MAETPHPDRTYRVLMYCCTDGHCDTCCNLPRGRRARVVHSKGVTKEYAEKVAKNWARWEPTIEEEVTR